PAGDLSDDHPSRFGGLPAHSRDGLAGFLNGLLSQLSRQASALTPRLPGGRPCVAHCLLGFLLYAHHVPSSCRRMLDACVESSSAWCSAIPQPGPAFC